ncbi:hypothetical protein [Azoarcus sp. KH32C]|nr:hypothetical protein [Azoarcus sp. KH32C]BAL24780.1 hypothetical protein AZKH_2474 [Azoarcus sp. KH32C]
MPIDPVVYLLLMVHAANRANRANRGGYRAELRAIGDVLRAFDDYAVSYQ